MEKIFDIIKLLVFKKFTGTIEITFNQGGIRGVKKVKREKLEI